ncbi:MAG: flagellar hook-associated protein FlgL [Acidobacteriia bacterium]|nr:flagellar hook-associated protein FlgL [Terriglobia bacterium]
MRVNPNYMPDLLAALNQAQLNSQKASLEVATSRSVNQPSDNPAASALLVQNNDQITFNTTYLQSLVSIQGQMQTADSTLSSVTTALQRAISLGVEGANGTLSDSNRAAVATELQGIQDQITSLANTSYQGRYIFAGTLTDAPPFVADNTVASGVRYDGNAAVNTVTVGNGYEMAVNQPGSQLFTAPGHDIFLALTNMIQALQSNTGYDTAVTAVRDAYDHLSAQRVFYGNSMNQAQSQTTYLNAAKLQLSQEENSLGGADLAAAATRLASSETSIQATLAAISKYSQMNLFDYLK